MSSLLQLIKANKVKYKKTSPLRVVNGEAVYEALINVNKERIAEYFVNGNLDFKQAFNFYHIDATIWHILVMRSSAESIQLLKDMLSLYEATYGHSVYPDELNTYHAMGRAPVHTAALSGNIEGMRILVKHGANPNLKDEEERTVFDLLKFKGYERLVPAANEIIERYKNGEFETSLTQTETKSGKLANKMQKDPAHCSFFKIKRCLRQFKDFIFPQSTTVSDTNSATEPLLEGHKVKYQ